MSSALPTVTALELVRALGRAGFIFKRQKGSHQIYQHAQTGQRASVPIHAGDVPKGTLRQILLSANLSPERLRELLEQ